MRVLRWGGIEAESELAFAALHELLRPVVRSWRSHRRPRLPVRPVPRASLEGRFLIGVAVLSLQRIEAGSSPLLTRRGRSFRAQGAARRSLARRGDRSVELHSKR
jgi:hypothetical protein